MLSLLQDTYKGIMGIGKISAGTIQQGQNVALARRDGSIVTSRVTSLLAYQGLERVEIDRADAGDIVAVAGFDQIGIGETITDAQNPVALQSSQPAAKG